MKKKPIDDNFRLREIENLVLKVVQHCRHGRLEEAEKICRTILERYPDHPQIFQLASRIEELRQKNKMVAGWVNKAMNPYIKNLVPRRQPIRSIRNQNNGKISSSSVISVIVCSAQNSTWNIHEKHIGRTIGCPHEYVRIDNAKGTLGIGAAYNLGVERASGDIFVFVHEDVFFVTPNWGSVLQSKFTMDESLGLVGVAGTQYLYPNNPRWNAAGKPFVSGRVIHTLKNENKCYLTAFSEEEADAQVVAVDGLFFAIKSSLFKRVRFDADTFDHFHFYDLDICMQVKKTHKLIVTHDILVKHWSLGACDSIWKKYGKRFLEKYSDELPVSIGDKTPDPEKMASFGSFELSNVLSSKILHHINNIEKGF
jgi:GT2 family glycosyltransferase